MTVPVQVFSYTDLGAPQMVIHNPYTFFQVIRQVLVGCNGIAYGTTPSAGWTLYGEDRKQMKLVIQQAGGNQRYLQLGCPKSLNPYNWFWSVTARMYENMWDIDSGLGQDPYISTNSNVLSEWGIPPGTGSNFGSDAGGYNAYNGAVPWWIIADDRFFYLRMDPVYINGGTSYGFMNTIYFFGDLAQTNPDDSYATVLWAYSTTQGAGGSYANILNSSTNSWGAQSAVSPFAEYSSAYGENGSNPNLWIMRPLSQNPQAISAPICNMVYNQSMSQMLYNSTYNEQQPAIQNSWYNKKQQLTPMMVVETGVKPRGYMPGLYLPSMQGLTNYSDRWQFTDNNGIPWILWQSWQAPGSGNGQWPLKLSGGANYMNVFIRLDTWRDSWDTA